MRLVYSAQCSCEPARELQGGGLPEYYQSESEAYRAFRAHEERHRMTLGEHRYWAVHARGRHVIAVLLG